MASEQKSLLIPETTFEGLLSMANFSLMTDTLLLIGILMNLVKGGDLLLRQHQKDWLQDHFEAFTLRLDDVRPVSWFGALSRPRPAVIWSICSALLVLVSPIQALGGALAFLLDLWIMSLRSLSVLDLPSLMALRVGLLVAVPVSVVCLWKVCPRLVRKLVGSGKTGPFFGRLLALYFLSVAIFSAFLGASRLADKVVIVQFILAALWPLLFPLFVLNAAGLLMVTLLFCLWILRPLFVVLKGICWRIAEYDRGVFAAFLLIATIALGIYRVAATGK